MIDTTQVRDIGSSKQLFIDHRFITSSDNIDLTVNAPIK